MQDGDQARTCRDSQTTFSLAINLSSLSSDSWDIRCSFSWVRIRSRLNVGGTSWSIVLDRYESATRGFHLCLVRAETCVPPGPWFHQEPSGKLQTCCLWPFISERLRLAAAKPTWLVDWWLSFWKVWSFLVKALNTLLMDSNPVGLDVDQLSWL